MKKRLLAMFLAVMMVFSLLPTSALAEATDVPGEEIVTTTSDNEQANNQESTQTNSEQPASDADGAEESGPDNQLTDSTDSNIADDDDDDTINNDNDNDIDDNDDIDDDDDAINNDDNDDENDIDEDDEDADEKDEEEVKLTSYSVSFGDASFTVSNIPENSVVTFVAADASDIETTEGESVYAFYLSVKDSEGQDVAVPGAVSYAVSTPTYAGGAKVFAGEAGSAAPLSPWCLADSFGFSALAQQRIVIVVSAPVMKAMKALAANAEGGTEVTDPCIITIEYIFNENCERFGQEAAQAWSTQIQKGDAYTINVTNPVVLGYQAENGKTVFKKELTAEDTKVSNIKYTVEYEPAEVNYTVIHSWQNVNDTTSYLVHETETKQGFTWSQVGQYLAKQYEGFTANIYDYTTRIAADGSTVVYVNYDRNYYMLSLDLDGGYGAESVYDMYGKTIDPIPNPQKHGYTFAGWDLCTGIVNGEEVYDNVADPLPTTMGNKNVKYRALWAEGKSQYTIAFWYENANNSDYSLAGSKIMDEITIGSEVSSGSLNGESFTGRDNYHFTYNPSMAETQVVAADGSTILNIYFTRNRYSIQFYVCSKSHTHNIGGTTDCNWVCGQTITAKWHADISSYFGGSIAGQESGFPWSVKGEVESVSGQDAQIKDTNLIYKQGKTGRIAIMALMPDATTNYLTNGFAFYAVNGEGTPRYYYYNIQNLDNDNYTPSHYKFTPKYGGFDPEDEAILIEGFDYYTTNPTKKQWDDGYHPDTINYYYNRLSFRYRFINADGKEIQTYGGSAKFGAPLKDLGKKTPPYPDDFEQGAYKFEGWYLDSNYLIPVVWDNNLTMPASPTNKNGDLAITFYAKWEPIIHKVYVYETSDTSETGTIIGDYSAYHGKAVWSSTL